MNFKSILAGIFTMLTVFQVYANNLEVVDKAKVIALTPAELGILNGKNPQSYSLFAVKKGKLEPIPYQFDEVRDSGFVYMKDINDKSKDDDPIVGVEGVFDGKDELLFMLKDAGERKTNFMKSDGQLVSEISVLNASGEPRYVYLVKDALVSSDQHYVRFSAQLGRVETDYYALKVDPGNAFMWEEFYYDSFVGEKAGRPLDTVTLRMYSNALAVVPLNLNNKHMIAKVVAEKSGPIRSTTEYKVVVALLKAPIMNFTLQIEHTEQAVGYNSRVFIPAIRRRMVSKAAMNASFDGYNLYGARVYASEGPTKPGIVDGEVSDIEKEMLKVEFKTNEPSWVLLSTKDGFSIMNHFIVETDEEIPMGIVYEENPDADEPPEYFKGQMPMLGFMMHRTPLKGFMQVTNTAYLFNDEVKGDAHVFAKAVAEKPKVNVTNF